MRDASTLLPYVSEITFPIQQRVEFGRLGELDLVDPAGALGVFVDKFGLADQRFVYTKDFAAYGGLEVLGGLDGLADANRAALLHLRADVRELNSGHIAELFLSVVRYSNGSDTVLDDDVLVILAVANLHVGPPRSGRCYTAAEKIPHITSSDTLWVVVLSQYFAWGRIHKVDPAGTLRTSPFHKCSRLTPLRLQSLERGGQSGSGR